MRGPLKLLLSLGLICGLIVGLQHLPFSPQSEARAPFLEASETNKYTFSGTEEDGAPITWDTCEPIRVLVETIGMPKGADAAVAKAVSILAEQSQVNLVYDGTVTGEHSQDWVTEARRKYGANPPILVGWTLLDADMGSADTIGFSSVTTTTLMNRSHISGAVVTIHTKRLAELRPGFGRGNSQGQVYLHELAHSLGLGHVPHSHQLMYESVNMLNGKLTSGDIEGLDVLARRMCTERAARS